MPSHSPELQLVERLWPLTNEPVANRTFKTLKELEEVVYCRCQTLLQQQELIRGADQFLLVATDIWLSGGNYPNLRTFSSQRMGREI